MKPSKSRLKNRTRLMQIMTALAELQHSAHSFVDWQRNADTPVRFATRAQATKELVRCALAFAVVVDGEDASAALQSALKAVK